MFVDCLLHDVQGVWARLKPFTSDGMTNVTPVRCRACTTHGGAFFFFPASYPWLPIPSCYFPASSTNAAQLTSQIRFGKDCPSKMVAKMCPVSSFRKNESFVYRCIMRQKLVTADIIRQWIGKFLRIDLIVSATRVTKARLLSVDRTLQSTKHWPGNPETLSITQAKRVSCQAKWTGSSRYKYKKLLGRIVSLSPNTFKWGVIEEYTYFVYKAIMENRNMWRIRKSK